MHDGQSTVARTSTAVPGVPRQRIVGERDDSWLPSNSVHIEPRAVRGRGRSRTATWLVLVDLAGLAAVWVVAPATPLTSGAALAGLLLLNAVKGRYNDPVELSLLDELPRLTAHVLIVGAVAMLLADVLGSEVHAEALLAFFATICGGRLVGYLLVTRLRRSRLQGRSTVIVGIGPVGRQIAAAMVDHPECGRLPAGWVDDEATTPTELSLLPLRGGVLPWLGDVRALPRLMAQAPECDVVVADTSVDERCLNEVLQRCDRCVGDIYMVPRQPEVHQAIDGPILRGIPLVKLSRTAHRSVSWRLKRVIDVVLAGIGLVLVGPLMGLCALAVYREGGRDVLFRQERVGQDMRRFTIFKLRSLAPESATESARRWSIQGDPRLGPFGRFLRTMSLDELPQLWNVLRGDMSLVGPRPERPFFVEQFSRRYPHYAARHRVPAGLTGWAQTSGLRGDTDISERARYDNAYIANWSLWNDTKILLRTAARFTARVSG
ncbi:MAG TPA: sugar transferase [Marmoricola sp.]|nr:sugar transferase [Marmoricola sp.]